MNVAVLQKLCQTEVQDEGQNQTSSGTVGWRRGIRNLGWFWITCSQINSEFYLETRWERVNDDGRLIGHYLRCLLIQIMLYQRFQVSDNSMHNTWDIKVTAVRHKNALKSERCAVIIFSLLHRADEQSEHILSWQTGFHIKTLIVS